MTDRDSELHDYGSQFHQDTGIYAPHSVGSTQQTDQEDLRRLAFHYWLIQTASVDIQNLPTTEQRGKFTQATGILPPGQHNGTNSAGAQVRALIYNYWKVHKQKPATAYSRACSTDWNSVMAKCVTFVDQAWPALTDYFKRIEQLSDNPTLYDPGADAELFAAIFNTVKAELVLREGTLCA